MILHGTNNNSGQGFSLYWDRPLGCFIRYEEEAMMGCYVSIKGSFDVHENYLVYYGIIHRPDKRDYCLDGEFQSIDDALAAVQLRLSIPGDFVDFPTWLAPQPLAPLCAAGEGIRVFKEISKQQESATSS